MNTLNFNDADLKANREGRLSDAQRKRLNDQIDRMPWKYKHAGLLFALYTFILLLGGVAVLDIRFRQELLFMLSLKDVKGSLRLVFTVSVWLGLPMIWDWWIVRRYAQGHIYTLEGENVCTPEGWRKRSFKKVVQANRSGKAILISKNLRKRIRIKVIVVKIRRGLAEISFFFRVEKPAYTFNPGQHYRVYFLSYYDRIHHLSAERIFDEKAKR